MKKIILLMAIIFVLSSCWLDDSKTDKNATTNYQEKNDYNKIVKLENLINNQKFDEAIPELEKMYNKDYKDISNILNYMSALLSKWSITRQEKEYSKKAIEIWNKALLEFPNNSELYRSIWYAYEIAEDYTNAFTNYDKSIELDSNNAMAFANRGHAYKLFWDYNKAEEDFLKAYELDNTNDFVLINLAWIYNIQLFDLDLALEYYNKTIEVTKNIRYKSEAFHSMWNIYIAKWKYIKSEESFRNAIKSDEKFELWYLWLSEIQMLNFLFKSEDKTEDDKKLLLQKALKTMK